MKNSASPISGPNYHHGKSQWFIKGNVAGGSQGNGLLYGSGQSPFDSSKKALPREPHKTDPLNQQHNAEPYARGLYHLQNFHDKGYESVSNAKNSTTFDHENHKRKQHFIRGVVPGGSVENRMIYGTDELLRQSRLKQQLRKSSDHNPLGFMYGTEAATNVGKQKPTRKPNNALLLEQRIFDDNSSKNKKIVFDQDDFLESHRREKQRQREQEQNEKKKDFEMLRSFEPWGRPGGGAPKKIGSNEQDQAKRTNAVSTLVQEEYTPFGSGRGGGGGAPNRTASGKPLTLLHSDPELRFPTYGHSDVAPSLRYKKDTSYGKDLENFMDEVKARKQLQRQESFEKELHHISQNPYGKPGGGAPLRNDKGKVKTFFPTTLSQDIHELRQVDTRHPHAFNNRTEDHENRPTYDDDHYDPWGKGYGTTVRDRSGKIVKINKPKTDDLDGIGMTIGRPGAGAPLTDRDGNLNTRKKQTLTRTAYGQTLSRDFSPKGNTYDPFGRPGAGAPMRDSDGKLKTHLTNKVERDTMDVSPNTSKNELRARQTYLKTLQDMKEQTYLQRKAEQEEINTSGADVASWLRSGVVGQPKFDPVTKEIVATHRHTSDVTQQKFNIRRQKNELSDSYHHDLELLAKERQQQRNREKEDEKKTSQEHVNTMNHIWGHPGGGAPLTKGDMINARKQKVGLAPADEAGFRIM